ncbi:phospholipase D-like domain-containing protein [Pseudomonas sp. Q2-TVG4-2]|uniref:phospholipase D-like domain-containing protein n=1 Tax=Pseudomonas sp. Q2-TVG4-2 TaxID=1685699 RepID=UPI0015E6DE1C|nr:phospholipase D-like domain-containing protein [Pseudomonas sp. Q2-TVG4-2]
MAQLAARAETHLAAHSVDLEVYLIEEGANQRCFLSALQQAAERGVTVRMLVDGLGSKRFIEACQQGLDFSGIQLRVFNPLASVSPIKRLHRDHRKKLIVDGQEIFIGGAGITDSFWNPDRNSFEWREAMVWAQGPVVADALDLFERLRKGNMDTRIEEPPFEAGPPEGAKGSGLLSFVASSHKGLVRRTNQWIAN